MVINKEGYEVCIEFRVFRAMFNDKVIYKKNRGVWIFVL